MSKLTLEKDDEWPDSYYLYEGNKFVGEYSENMLHFVGQFTLDEQINILLGLKELLKSTKG